MCLLSIITVNLNDAAGLERTAGSVAPVLRPGIEWLILDGGSSDGSCEVIRRHRDALAFWQSRPDGGVYDAMNQGLARATGRYVLFLNAGDRLAPGPVLDLLLQHLARPDPPDLLFCDAALEFAGGRQIVRPARAADRYLRYGLPALHQATLIRRETHQRVPYDLSYRITGDYAAVARLIVGGASWTRWPDRLAIRACSPSALSEREWRRRIREALRVQREIIGAGVAFRCLSFLRLLSTHLAHVALGTFCRSTGRWNNSIISRLTERRKGAAGPSVRGGEPMRTGRCAS